MIIKYRYIFLAILLHFSANIMGRNNFISSKVLPGYIFVQHWIYILGIMIHYFKLQKWSLEMSCNERNCTKQTPEKVFNFATKKRIFCSKHWLQQNTTHMEKVPLSWLLKALNVTIIITWNSNTLSEPQSHIGMSSSLGLPSSETQRGSPLWW